MNKSKDFIFFFNIRLFYDIQSLRICSKALQGLKISFDAEAYLKYLKQTVKPIIHSRKFGKKRPPINLFRKAVS